MDVSVSQIVSAIECLLSLQEGAGGLAKGLDLSLQKFQEFIHRRSGQDGGSALQRRLSSIDREVVGLLSEPVMADPVQRTYVEFTARSLSLLYLLNETLSSSPSVGLTSVSEAKATPEDKPAADARTSRYTAPLDCPLSVAHQQCVRRLLQFVVCLGLYPFLLPGADAAVRLRLARCSSVEKNAGSTNNTNVRDSAALSSSSASSASLSSSAAELRGARHLVRCVRVLLCCAESPVLGPLVLVYHFTDVLAALLQVCYGPTGGCSDSAQTGSSGDSAYSVLQAGMAARGHKFDSTQSFASPADIGTLGAKSCPPRNKRGRCGLSSMERDSCVADLQKLLNRVHQPQVVKELLLLQGLPLPSEGGRGANLAPRGEPRTQGRRGLNSPRWLQRACGQLLSERLMQRNGVQHILRGFFEVGTTGNTTNEDSSSDWRKCRAVAQIIATCPALASSVEDYYSLVCPQVLALLRLPSKGVGRSFLRVATETIASMYSQQELLSRKYLVCPLIGPLRWLAGDSPVDAKEVDGLELQTCLSGLCKIVGVLEPTSALLGGAILPYLPIVFEAFKAAFVCHLSGTTENLQLCEGLLGQLLRPLNKVTILSFFEFILHISFTSPIGGRKSEGAPQSNSEISLSFKRMKVEYCLSLGTDGTWSVRTRESEETNLKEDNKVVEMERTADCVVRLLLSELKSCEVAGDLLISCLRHLSIRLSRNTKYNMEGGGGGGENMQPGDHVEIPLGEPAVPREGSVSSENCTVLLDCESHPTEADVLVLCMAAALCERLSGQVLQQAKLSRLLPVLSALVKAHAHFASSAQGSGGGGGGHRTGSREGGRGGGGGGALLLVSPDLDRLVGGPITLSMAFGLLSAVLGGGTGREVDRSERPLLSDLLPSLEVLSSGAYPAPELCDLAGELRVCIATLGAVWSVDTRESAAAMTRDAVREAKSKAVEYLASRDRAMPNTQQVELEHDSKVAGSGHEPCRDQLSTIHSATANPVTSQPSPLSASEAAQQSPPSVMSSVARGREGERGGGGEEGGEGERGERGGKGEGEKGGGGGTLEEALQDLRDPLLPVRAHGLVALTRLVESRDKEALSQSSKLVSIFKESLAHSDSYVYLPAINGLVAMATVLPNNVIPFLCQEYAQLDGKQHTQSHDEAVGSASGGGGSKSLGRDRVAGTSRASLTTKRQVGRAEFRMKLGEALVKAAGKCGETLPHYSGAILASVLSTVRDPDPLVRASGLSNLADVCPLLRFSFTQVKHEVLDCLAHTLQADKEPKVRQAALTVLRLLLKGLSQDFLQVLGDSLGPVYSLLKQVEGTDPDPLTQTHAQAALGELDTAMRRSIFPPQTLSKKISILDIQQ